MKLMPFFLLFLLFCSCKRISRDGLSESDRNYTPIHTEITSSQWIPADGVYVLQNQDRAHLFHSIFTLTDSVFGKDFETELKKSSIEEDLHKHFFKSLAIFESKKRALDQKNLEDVTYKEYFESEAITPMRNFDDFIEYNKPFLFTTYVDDYLLKYKVEMIILPEWKKLGEFKSVANEGQTTTISTHNAYGQIITIRITFIAKNIETGKTEYYEKLLDDSCITYTVMDFERLKLLNH